MTASSARTPNNKVWVYKANCKKYWMASCEVWLKYLVEVTIHGIRGLRAIALRPIKYYWK